MGADKKNGQGEIRNKGKIMSASHSHFFILVVEALHNRV